ncbi:hypothetical protein [Burkholderia sp. WSM2230]|uniref:hypothetical protein n=1 Tax=Burkholderia sp. WSM2230 TaxID=944435 RepID=UPI001E5F61B4|nr:hypothetical protein [Burkholderia sp. WSM2230]
MWSPSRELANPYATIEEPLVVQSAHQRLRVPLALAASALVVASTVYMGFIHNGDSDAESEPVGVSGAIKQQNMVPPAIATMRPATASPVRSTVVAAAAAPREQTSTPPTSSTTSASTQPASSPLAARRAVSAISSSSAAAPASSNAATVSAQAKRNPGAAAPLTAEEKARADLSRHLRAARASLQNNNLFATKTRLAAAMAVQPQSREAQNLRAVVNTREQQREALLSLARGCGSIARWDCVARNASSALEIDSSSKEARHLVTLAMQESALATAEAVAREPEPAPDTRDVNAHH